MSSEEVELLSDSKYRQFIAAVEKALKYFESSGEWADLISALGKLNKVLLSNSKFSIIPRKLMIGKRLSQCTHPALPSGVHLKALEVYDVIFQRIGTKRLPQDLFIYSAGLFPLMGHAAMSVKPLLMKLYEDHFLPLGTELLPGLPGLLLALLPGIEEGSDYTERTISLLENFSSCTDEDIFFEALWQSMITTPTVRLPATIFLLSQLDKRLSPKEQRCVMGKNHAFMVQGLCLSLNDKLSLVQRNILDFLVQHLPLHRAPLPQHHLSAIMTAGLGVLLRRDMSLNRRLYTWILGTSGDGSQGLAGSESINEDDVAKYFEMYGKHLVVTGIRNLFRQHIGVGIEHIATKKATKLELLKPFRILLNLLDKPEIGSAILEDILVEVFENLFQNWQHFGRKSKEKGSKLGRSGDRNSESGAHNFSKESAMEELIKTANLLFNTFEPYFMWQYIAKLLAQCREMRVRRVVEYRESGESDPEVVGKKEQMDKEERLEMINVIRLTDFILNIVALEASVEIESKHWPELLAEIIQELTKGCQSLTFEELEEGILLCSKLLSKVTPSTNVVRDNVRLLSPSFSPDEGELNDIQESQNDSNESSPSQREPRDDQSRDDQSRDDQSRDDQSRDDQSRDDQSRDEHAHDDQSRDEQARDDRSHQDESCDDQSHEGDKSRDSQSRDTSRGERLSTDEGLDVDGEIHANDDESPENKESRGNKERTPDVKPGDDDARDDVNGESFRKPRFVRDGGNEDGDKEDGWEEGKGKETGRKREEVQNKQDGADGVEKGKKDVGETKDVKKKKDGKKRKNSEGKSDGKRRESIETKELGKETKSTNNVKKKDKRKRSSEELVEKEKKRDKRKEHKSDRKDKKKKVNGRKEKRQNIENEKHPKSDSVFSDETEDAEGLLGINMTNTEQVSQSVLIRNCITHFQTFVLEFFRCKILHSEECKEFLEKDGLRKINELNIVSEKSRKITRSLSEEYRESSPGKPAQTYIAACKLLVELSCFPMQNKGTECETLDESLEKEDPSLPSWLRCLIACCCEVDDFDIQSTSVATLLDLINLTLSVSSGSSGGIAGATVIPILTFQEVMIIEQSNIYQVIANNLWSILGRSLTIHHRKAVELLIQLHNLTPSPYLCENVIGSSMVSECKDSRLEALKRFANLWHIAKSILAQNVGRTARGLRTFDRSLFVMLDGLESEEPEMRSLTKMWVSHSLEQGDIGRILEPLLLLLLHPSTARVSHYFSEKEKTKAEAHLRRREEVETQGTDKVGGCEEDGEKEDGEKEGGEKEDGEKEVGEKEDGLEGEGVKEDMEYVDQDPEIEIVGECDDPKESTEEINTEKTKPKSSDDFQSGSSHSRRSDIHKLHYSGKCDYQRILYAFRTISSVLRVVPRQFVCAAAATSIGSSFGPYEERIKELLIRHKRSLFGKGFYGLLYGGSTGSTSEATSAAKFTIKPNTSKYLEILITISLYFIRSHYLPTSNVEPEFIEGNIKTQVASLECLSNLIWELVKLVRESGHGFGNFITDLLSRCKVQKAIVHCLAATTKSNANCPDTFRGSSVNLRTSTDNIRVATDNIRVATDATGVSKDSPEMPSDVTRAFDEAPRRLSVETVDHMILQSKLLEVVESLIVLEHALLSCYEALTPDHVGNSDFEIIMKGGEDEGGSVAASRAEACGVSRFIQGKSLSSQEMLLNMVIYCLKAQGNLEMKSRWTGFVIDCLPYLGSDLKKWVVPVVLQMCSNLSDVATLFEEMNLKNDTEKKNKSLRSPPNKQFPPDHLLAVLAGLTSICHFCLLEAVSSPVLAVQPRAGGTVSMVTGQSMPSDLSSPTAKSNNSMQILTNLLHAFSSNSKANDSPSGVQNFTPLLEAREGLLSVLPRVIATLLTLWGTWNLDEPFEPLPSSMALLGTAKALRQSILQLLTPIAMTHTLVFVASIADVWNSKKLAEKDLETNSKSTSFLTVTNEQLKIIKLVLDIKALSLEVVIATVKQILHQEKVGSSRQPGFEASLLHFFHEFLLCSSLNHITQAKSSFLALLKDGLQLNLPTPAVFLLLLNLHSYNQKVPGKEDRRLRKDSQDVAQRLIEACTTIAGLSLGSSAWFRRNLAVISVPDPSANEVADEPEVEPANGENKSEAPAKPPASSTGSKYSTQALVVLAEILAPLLDMVFGREEKERVVYFLIQVMGNVIPYLRNHSVANVPSFRACCSLVASLSGYQYTRKAWRREMFELFFEPNFFQMDKECIGMWRTIIDNLFTQDQASFRELVARATVTASATLSFFGNHDQEMQQRALMLKRLAFAVFSSEPDQYESSLPIVQERLAECLRMPQVPVIHEQVFLFFRVLLVRMSNQLTFIWPMIISEMIHVFLLMESDLLQSDTPSRDQQMFYSETVLGASGYVNYSQEKWLGLYLSVCKLLDMALCLPPEQLPQFQMYRWAFEGSTTAGPEDHVTNLVTVFTPYVNRITKLLAKRKNIYVPSKPLECHAGRPLLTMYQLESVEELLPFLRLLSTEGRIIVDLRCGEKGKSRKPKIGASKNFIERLIERDFLEPMKE